MCGIVGYLGPKNPKDVILTGLKSLEYRGYDSAGVSILHEGKFKRVRAEGKLGNLSTKLDGEAFSGHLGIGHTRWATHGKPSERNAHPHVVGGISLVHNGIIENYMELREELKKQGAKIESDTDSELVAHLIEREVRGGADLLEAVKHVKTKIWGAYSILVVSEKQPDTMVAFKYGPPLILAAAMAALEREGRLASGPVVPALARGFGAFLRQDWPGAIAAIEPVLAEHERIGGSRAQRDLVEFTLLRAYLAAGRLDDLRRMLAARQRGPKVMLAGLDAVH